MTLITEMLNSMGSLALNAIRIVLLFIFAAAYFAGGIHAVLNYGLSGLIALLIASILSYSFVDAISRSEAKAQKKNKVKSDEIKKAGFEKEFKAVDKNIP